MEPITTITTTSTHLPGQLLEVAEALQSVELNSPLGSRPENISIAFDTELLSVTIVAKFPLTLFDGIEKERILTNENKRTSGWKSGRGKRQ